MNDHRCMRDIAAAEVVAIASRVLGEAGLRDVNAGLHGGVAPTTKP
jgi:hypothetical protein